ncbi:glycosyltransferase [Segetibacter sp. 3557_3]|uniref:glycosyltransferase n=1 Tax=Segetibacter sp. 3557_3 TaxID=2547429 RepID=UPI001404C151|nr:glycosyltransferase [Segetibacter sp. 3557_3]
MRNQPKSIVLFNDFDQPTANFWAPFFKLFRSHRFAVILHDPDRDQFFPFKALSRFTMSSIMSFMDVAFYHGVLPDRPYYKGKFCKVKVPHGIYDNREFNQAFLEEILHQANGSAIVGVLGNIREEKNYEVIIESLKHLKHVKLLVAGQASNSGVSVGHYHELAAKFGVSEQIIWVDRYLDQHDFNAAIEACNIVLLYYKPSFTSQSGVLNSIATFHKMLIISNTESSLKDCVSAYNLGAIIPHSDVDQLTKTIVDLLEHNPKNLAQNWENYIREASWEKHVAIAVESYKQILG